MSSEDTPTTRQPGHRRPSGRHVLADDPTDLTAFAAAAQRGTPARPPARPPLRPAPAPRALSSVEPTGAPATALPAEPGSTVTPPAAAEPATAEPVATDAGHQPEEDLPDGAQLTPRELLMRQATYQVDASVRERFTLAQRRAATQGPKPSNTAILLDALRATYDRYKQIVDHHQQQPLPDGPFSRPVPGRRLTTEARLTSQINFRLAYGEIEDIQRYASDAGASSVSAFINAILDEFLPHFRGVTRSGNRPAAR